tara:strand:- start:182 stop:418 length:237 start_codon:yes stop_codon:yes gene_type:complete
MYLLGLGLLVLSSWYLIKLYNNFNNDPIAKKEIDNAWQEAKKDVKGKNPFAPGRIKEAINAYKADIKKTPNKTIQKNN